MPKITALIHTKNDALRLGRALDSLRVCDQVIVVDHGSSDNTEKVARDHGAEFKKEVPALDCGAYAVDARHEWILCLCANESLSEPLEASLFEWKTNEHDQAAFNFRIKDETEQGWKNGGAETRLVNITKLSRTGIMPPMVAASETVAGEILRFQNP